MSIWASDGSVEAFDTNNIFIVFLPQLFSYEKNA